MLPQIPGILLTRVLFLPGVLLNLDRVASQVFIILVPRALVVNDIYASSWDENRRVQPL